VTEVIEV